MTRRCSIARTAAILMVCGLAAAGCGTGDYDRIVADRGKELTYQTKFTVLYEAPTEVPESLFRIRIPQVFTNAFTTGSLDATDNLPLGMVRLHPPFGVLPGYKVTYEALAETQPRHQVPYYCYLAAGPSNKDAPMEAQLLAMIKALPNAPAAWEPVACDTPEYAKNEADRKKIAWKRITVKWDQAFDVVEGQRDTRKLPGTLDLWLYEGGGGYLIVGWRWPTEAEGKVAVAEFPAVTAGTLSVVEAPPADAAPPAQ